MCVYLCFCPRPARPKCEPLKNATGHVIAHFCPGINEPCSCSLSEICKFPSTMLFMHVIIQTHKCIQLSLLQSSGNRHFWFWAGIVYLGPSAYFDVFAVLKNPYSAAVLWNVAVRESPNCEIWGYFIFLCWSAVGFCDLQLISVQYILYVCISETAQCLQEMHSFAVGHMGSFACLWWR